jgi:hypothetical protein
VNRFDCRIFVQPSLPSLDSPTEYKHPTNNTSYRIANLLSLMMATSLDPNTPVPLDTIPISPAGANGDGATKEVKTADGEQVTVFHDADNFNVKHPLMNKWTLWFTKPPSGKVRFSLLCCLSGPFSNICDSLGRQQLG